MSATGGTSRGCSGSPKRAAPPIVAARHRAVAPDLVGFGRSDKPIPRSEYTYQRHVDWLRAVLFDRARRVLPGGVSSPVRAFAAVGGTPLFFKEAEGAHFVDADGRRYLDFVHSWGPLILGHAHAEVLAAVDGPAIVEQMDSTVVVPPDWRAEVDDYGNIVLRLR